MTARAHAGGPLPRYLLLAVVLFLTLFGLVMIYSASSVADYAKYHDSAYHLKKQAEWLALGLLALGVCARIDYRLWKKLAWPLLIAADVMLVFTLTHGIGKWGATRWLYIGGVGIQPSEFAKLAVVLTLSLVMSDKRMRQLPFTTRMLWYGAILLPVLGLIMKQPDMGTTMSIVIAAYVLLLIAGLEWRYLIGTAAAIAAAVPAMIFLEPYRAARFLSFLDPWKDPRGDGYQIIQALYAFGSGGLHGVGLGLSRQKFFYLPAAHTDFIFAIIGEEMGLLGTLAVVIAFLLLAYAGIRIAIGAKDRFGKLLAGGLTSLVVVQAILNIAAVTGMMPVTGIPLPLVSAGGSSLMLTMGCLGVVLSVSAHGSRAERARSGGERQEETIGASAPEWRRDGRPRLSSIDGGRKAVRRGA